MASVETNYPDLYEALFPVTSDASASAPPLEYDGTDTATVEVLARALDDSASTSFVAAHNDACPFCKMKFAGSVRPVAVLQCGHAYHLHCGRALLQKGEGRECTEDTCHRDAAKVMASRMREAIFAAAARGEIVISELQDPVRARDAKARVAHIMRDAGMPLTDSVVKDVSAAAAAEDDESARTESAHRMRWRETDVGKNGFGLRHRLMLLTPYMNAFAATKHSARIVMTELFALEGARRRAEVADDRAEMRAHLTGEASPADIAGTVREVDDEMRPRISFQKLAAAGLTITDIYFGLGVTTWAGVKALGITKTHITNKYGNVPLLAVMNLYKIKFEAVRSDLGVMASDIAEAEITPDDMRRAKISFPLLWVHMELNKELMASMRFSPAQWTNDIGFDKKYMFKPLELCKQDLPAFGWTADEVQDGFNLADIEMRSLLGAPSVPIAMPATVPVHIQEQQQQQQQRQQQLLLQHQLPHVAAAQRPHPPQQQQQQQRPISFNHTSMARAEALVASGSAASGVADSVGAPVVPGTGTRIRF